MADVLGMNLSGVSFIPDVSGFGSYMNYIMGFLVLVIIAIYVYRYLKYNINVRVYEPIGDSYKFKRKDRAGVFKDKHDGVTKFFLLKTKAEPIPIQEAKYFYFEGKRKAIHVCEIMPGKIIPFSMGKVSDEAELNLVKQDLDFWETIESKSKQNKYESTKFWDKWAGPIIAGGLLVIAGVVFILAIDKAGEIMVKQASNLPALTDKLDRILTACLSNSGVLK